MKRFAMLTIVALFSLAMVARGHTTAAAGSSTAVVRFAPVGDPNLHGVAILRQLRGGGTSIRVVAIGLEPGHSYVSLYYGNEECALEPYSPNDIIGGEYTANRGGVGLTNGTADDDLDEIHSVSVRDALTFDLLGCAFVSPENG
jgi:hypothetical protein